MNLLSLFNGISGGMLACERAGLKIDKHYISEIDKYANIVTMKNYPDSIQLGDVTKWQDWGINFSNIDIVIAGFPCTTWSIAGKQLGDKDERGMLFWVMLDVLKTVKQHNPKANFIIENVKMKSEFEQYITFHTEQALGKVNKYLINSASLSAQQRKRYYWTNIEGVEQPEDKGILLKDILEDNNLTTEMKSYALTTRYSGYSFPHDSIKHKKSGVFQPIHEPLMIQTARGFNKGGIKALDGKTPPMTSSCWQENNKLIAPIRIGDIGSKAQAHRVYSVDGKTISLSANGGGQGAKTGLYKIDLPDGKYTIRKLTPIECERLQTYPDNWTEGISNSQRYKCLGNSFTVDVIAHILRGMIR